MTRSTDEAPLSAIERALVATLVAALVKELRAEPQPERKEPRTHAAIAR